MAAHTEAIAVNDEGIILRTSLPPKPTPATPLRRQQFVCDCMETEPELSSRPASVEESVLREVFKRIDRNGDGALTRAEIILRLRKDEELASLLQLPQKLLDDDRSA